MSSLRSSRASSPPSSLVLVFAMAAAAAMLAIAHAFQTFGHLPPCELCLSQRDGYWAALWIGLIGLVASRIWRRAPSLFAVVLGLVFLAEAMLAAYHAGVEWKWWPGPTACTGDHVVVTASAMADLMRGVKFHMVRCDQAAWRWLGLSMAGWNAVAALAFAVASFAAAPLRRRR